MIADIFNGNEVRENILYYLFSAKEKNKFQVDNILKFPQNTVFSIWTCLLMYSHVKL